MQPKLLIGVIGLACLLFAATTMANKVHEDMANATSIREKFEGIFKMLWQYLDSSFTGKAYELQKGYESCRLLISENMNYFFPAGKYDIIDHSLWTLLERDFLQIEGTFDLFKNLINHLNQSWIWDKQDVQEMLRIVIEEPQFSLHRTFEKSQRVMLDLKGYMRAILHSKKQSCYSGLSSNYFLYFLANDIALVELKGYVMLQAAWLLGRVNGIESAKDEAFKLRKEYYKRVTRTEKKVLQYMAKTSRTVWRCDPNKHVKGRTYEEVTRLLRGYIADEADLNEGGTCYQDCGRYKSGLNGTCESDDDICVRQQPCGGKLFDCRNVQQDMQVCPSPAGSTRRLDYIEYNDGTVLGRKTQCDEGAMSVGRLRRVGLWDCSTCFCWCDEATEGSDRYFNLRETTSDLDSHKVVTGVRFVKSNKIFHLQIQQGQLGPYGTITPSTVSWVPVEDYTIEDPMVYEGTDFHKMTYQNRALDLDTIQIKDPNFVITGLRLEIVRGHLNLHVRYTPVDTKAGKLVEPLLRSYWTNTDLLKRNVIRFENPDIPVLSTINTAPTSKPGEFIEFTSTDMTKDLSQTTVPFVDLQEVVSNPAVPLSGVGIYFKSNSENTGGFIAPQIVTYDIMSQM